MGQRLSGGLVAVVVSTACCCSSGYCDEAQRPSPTEQSRYCIPRPLRPLAGPFRQPHGHTWPLKRGFTVEAVFKSVALENAELATVSND